jgi:hypothetical protein
LSSLSLLAVVNFGTVASRAVPLLRLPAVLGVPQESCAERRRQGQPLLFRDLLEGGQFVWAEAHAHLSLPLADVGTRPVLS